MLYACLLAHNLAKMHQYGEDSKQLGCSGIELHGPLVLFHPLGFKQRCHLDVAKAGRECPARRIVAKFLPAVHLFKDEEDTQ